MFTISELLQIGMLFMLIFSAGYLTAAILYRGERNKRRMRTNTSTRSKTEKTRSGLPENLQTYQTGRGARIAMGKLSDGWTHTTTKWI